MGGMIDHGDRGASCAQSFASDWGGRGGTSEEGEGSFSDEGPGSRTCGPRPWKSRRAGDRCRIEGGCTLSHTTGVKYQPFNRTPDSSGGIKSIIDPMCEQCDFRPGGILSSGMARIGITGFAEAGGTVGTPKFKSMLRPFAAASMLPQGRPAGEHSAQHESIRRLGRWAGSHLFLCYRLNVCIDCQCGSSATLCVLSRKPFHAIVCFRLVAELVRSTRPQGGRSVIRCSTSVQVTLSTSPWPLSQECCRMRCSSMGAMISMMSTRS